MNDDDNTQEQGTVEPLRWSVALRESGAHDYTFLRDVTLVELAAMDLGDVVAIILRPASVDVLEVIPF